MQDKAEVRKELLRRRDRIPPEVRKAKDRIIREKLLSLEEFRNAAVMFFFASFRTEVDTTELIQIALATGKQVVLPKVNADRHELLLFEVRDFGDLAAGYMGIPEPSAGARQTGINDVDIVIIPGAGYDASGNRVGYGGGYYDRLLSGLQKDVPVIAPAYEEQVLDAAPSEPHDVRVNVIVTDRRTIRCGP
jgi:5-formyltetrahydrofolate cyclo-ligase